MSKEILKKYSPNIKKVIRSLNIYPEDYKFKKSMDVNNWQVYFRCMRVGEKIKRYSFRRVKVNGEMVSINRIKDHEDRVEAAELLRDTIKYDLETHPTVILQYMYGTEEAKRLYPQAFNIPLTEDNREFVSIEKAFEQIYKEVSSELTETSSREYISKWNSFLEYIGDDKNNDVRTLNKSTVRKFLKDKTKGLSNTSFNNLRQLMYGMVRRLVESDYLEYNFVEGISRVKGSSTKNKAFTKEQMDELSKLLKDDLYMRFYCNHILCGLMRPTTINRLKVKDIDLENKRFILNETKTNLNGKAFVKHIVNPLMDVYKELDLSDKEAFIFGKNGLVERWVNTNVAKRQRRASNLFKKYKDEIGAELNK